MILQTLLAILLLTEAPAVAAAPATVPAPAPAVAPAAQTPPAQTDPVILEIDRLMAAWKGKNGSRLRGRLGLSSQTRVASDGIVMFWRNRSEATACGVDDAGNMRCGVVGGAECVFGIAFETNETVKNWKASGAGEACEKFAEAIGVP